MPKGGKPYTKQTAQGRPQPKPLRRGGAGKTSVRQVTGSEK